MAVSSAEDSDRSSGDELRGTWQNKVKFVQHN